MAPRRLLLLLSAALTGALGVVAACSTEETSAGDDLADAGRRNEEDEPLDAGGQALGDACASPEAGIGTVCAKAEDCPCNLTCSALRCVPRSKCDEALLSWDAPTDNTDGTCLTDLGGFTIRWGREAGGPHPLQVDAGLPCNQEKVVGCGGDAGLIGFRKCSWRLTGLEAGTWHFAIHAYNEAGVESSPSAEASKNIACP